ncbi:MAG: DUF3047 domain-containing protein [Bacteroidetes bacterium]|nr:DUF3047 domain-containing protein [Bacteroidota bacterium]MDE2671140.1 DUF3047 domain-containing protein [Bacteroidota bacterium]
MRVTPLLLLIILTNLGTGNAFSQEFLVIEDFEQYEVNSLPHLWRMPDKNMRSMRELPLDHARPNDFVDVVAEDAGNVLRAYTEGESVQVALSRADELVWNIESFPRLRWRWRADELPDGAREDTRSLNDTGAALYVAFDCNDWLGRPCTIKYTYSSTLPTDTRVRYGRLFAWVVTTASDVMGEWVTIERNVVQDYERIFGRTPPGNPIYIMIWSDSDNTGGVADVYFDDLVVLAEG